MEIPSQNLSQLFFQKSLKKFLVKFFQGFFGKSSEFLQQLLSEIFHIFFPELLHGCSQKKSYRDTEGISKKKHLEEFSLKIKKRRGEIFTRSVECSLFKKSCKTFIATIFHKIFSRLLSKVPSQNSSAFSSDILLTISSIISPRILLETFHEDFLRNSIMILFFGKSTPHSFENLPLKVLQRFFQKLLYVFFVENFPQIFLEIHIKSRSNIIPETPYKSPPAVYSIFPWIFLEIPPSIHLDSGFQWNPNNSNPYLESFRTYFTISFRNHSGNAFEKKTFKLSLLLTVFFSAESELEIIPRNFSNIAPRFFFSNFSSRASLNSLPWILPEIPAEGSL